MTAEQTTRPSTLVGLDHLPPEVRLSRLQSDARAHMRDVKRAIEEFEGASDNALAARRLATALRRSRDVFEALGIALTERP